MNLTLRPGPKVNHEEKNLYAILGVGKSATLKEIAAAYKKLAMRHHPDRNGGDQTLFLKVKQAFDILSDPEKRRLYDENGLVGDEELDLIEAAKNEIRGCFQALFDETNIDEIIYKDFVAETASGLQAALSNNIKMKHQCMHMLKKLDKAEQEFSKRLTHKRGAKDVIFSVVIRQNIEILKSKLIPVELNIKRLNIALSILKSYSFSPDKRNGRSDYEVMLSEYMNKSGPTFVIKF